MNMMIKGIIMGFIVVLPGMSGGTLLLIMGIYEKLLKDLSRLRLLPWLPFIVGAGGGIILSGMALTWLFQAYRDLFSTFLLGSVLASIKAVLGTNYHVNPSRMFLFISGAALGLVMADAPIGLVNEAMAPGVGLLFIGGAVASAAMLIPGIPGSSVLIVLGIYDHILNSLATLEWINLSVFAVGAIAGIFGLANALDKFYSRYRALVGWFFSGLIIGSGRMLLPASLVNPVALVVAGIAGFALVWWWGDKKASA